MDCHGGVDPTSFSALRSCDVTLMITEADNVTFAGTLELLTYFEEKLASSDHRRSQRIKFIVNRLPSKYKYEQLDRLYEPYFKEDLGTLSSDKSVFCYIPWEQLLADSFGEYPFHLPLAPASIFSQKLRYVTYEVLNSEFDLKDSGVLKLKKFFNDRYRQKIVHRVVSNEQNNVNAVMNFFSWFSVFFILTLLVLALLIGLWDSSNGVTTSGRDPAAKVIASTETLSQSAPFLKDVAIAVVIALAALILWYLLTALVGTMRYFRSKHQYQARLFRVLRGPGSLWQWLALSRSFILRWATALGVWFIGFYFSVLAVAAAVAFLGWL